MSNKVVVTCGSSVAGARGTDNKKPIPRCCAEMGPGILRKRLTRPAPLLEVAPPPTGIQRVLRGYVHLALQYPRAGADRQGRG